MSAISQSVQRTRIEGYPARNKTFEIVVGFLSALFVFGLFVDGWAHNHGKVDQSFFTPYHGIMYGSFALLGLTLVGMQFYNVSKGYSFLKALPYGYLTSLVGILVFGFGGAADLLWHLAFGIEIDIEALISPSHLVLIIGYVLILGSLIQAAWARREQETTWGTLWQTLIAWAGVLSVLLFIMQYVYFINDLRDLVGGRPGDNYTASAIGTMHFLVSSLLFTGVSLLMVRRWQLPFGALTFVYSISALLMGWMLIRTTTQNDFWTMMFLAVAPAVLAGLVADILIWRLKPSLDRRWAFYVLGAVIPLVLCLAFMGSTHVYGLLVARSGLWWRVHMWLGVPMLAMIVGALQGVMVMPPRVPREEH
jgi:hypothetical protein